MGWAGVPELDAGKLHRDARRRSGIDLDLDARCQLPLQLIVDDYSADPNLTCLGKWIARGMLVGLLENRLMIRAATERLREIETEKLESPLFVVGLPRSGTTFLYHLLCQDPAHRPLMFWETMCPVSPRIFGRADRRKNRARRTVRGLNRLAPGIGAIHEFVAEGPDECTGLLLNTFVTPYFRGNLPGFRRWLFESGIAELGRAYQEYALQLKILQRLDETRRNWVLKSPSHLFGLNELLEEFPEAEVILIQRRLEDSVASLCSLSYVLDSISYRVPDPVQVGRRTMEIVVELTNGLQRALSGRHADRIHRVQYDELVQSPGKLLRSIYDRLGRCWSPELSARVGDFETRGVDRANAGKVHQYQLQDYGLTSTDLKPVQEVLGGLDYQSEISERSGG